MRKGITPVVAIVILLIIALGVVGLAYGFISGIIGTATGKAVFLSGLSPCTGGLASINMTNVGTQTIANDGPGEDVSVTRTSCTGANCVVENYVHGGNFGPNAQGWVSDSGCGIASVCIYDVRVGPVSYPTRAAC